MVNVLDFDDLLVETIVLFNQFPEVLARYYRRYTHLLADEYQHINRVQCLLLKALAAKNQDICGGDENQRIYTFRGADIRHICSLEDDYPTSQVVLLEQNYRSTYP